MTKKSFRLPYFSVVHPLLEYAIQTVSRFLLKDIDLMTGLVKGLWRFPHEQRLEILGLPSLVHPRLRAEVILVSNVHKLRVSRPIEEVLEPPAYPKFFGHRFNLRHQLSHFVRR